MAIGEMEFLPKAEQGLPRKEWNGILDKYLKTGTFDQNQIEFMDAFQQGVINEIKKAIKRITK